MTKRSPASPGDRFFDSLDQLDQRRTVMRLRDDAMNQHDNAGGGCSSTLLRSGDVRDR
jgi:hypothetical protein